MKKRVDSKQTAEPLDLKYFIDLCLKNWKFIAIILFTALFLTYFKNKTSIPVYLVQGSIVVHEEDNLGNMSSILLQEIGIPSSSKNFANELLVLKSSPLLYRTQEKLDFQISYFEHTRFKNNELYKTSPFIVVIDQNKPQAVETPIHLEIIDGSSFKLSAEGEKTILYSFVSDQIIETLPKFNINTTGEFSDQISDEYYSFKIILNKNFVFDNDSQKKYSFIIHRPKDIIKAYQESLEVLPVDLESSVAQVTINSEVPQKSIDFINSLFDSYIRQDEDRKNHISVKTIEYINNQLRIVQDSLKTAEENLQKFRSRNRVVDISMQAGQVYDELRLLETEKATELVNIKYYEYLENYFVEHEEFSDLITPAGMGITDPLLNNLIEELITLNSEKVTFIENKQEKSPYLKKIDIRIENIRNMIFENISYVKNASNIKLEGFDSRMNQLNAEIRKLPQTERELLGMQRKFNLNDEIYTYLLEKQAEAEIAKASNQSDAEVLEPADVIHLIGPKKKMNYIIAVIMSLMFSVVMLRLYDVFRNTFTDRNEIRRALQLPLLGQIYHNNKKIEPVIINFPKSHISESIRKLRINMNYFLTSKTSKAVLVTSTISQEGKSFLALNVALALAKYGKKTILLGFDLRKPKIYDRLLMKETLGLSDFLSEQVEMNQIIQKTNQDNLDVIWSGNVPPNPSELIAKPQTDNLITSLKEQYDYVIIDTAPIGTVSDSYFLLPKADLKMFVVRVNHSLKKETIEIIADLKEKEIDNLTLVINDIQLMRKTKYGYGYYEEDNKK